MSKESPSPKTSQPQGASSVGYRHPPKHSRFKPGQSGNPKGRRKGQRNIHTVLKEALGQRITIREGNRTRSLTKLDGIIVTAVNAALKGDAKALASLITLMRSLGMTGEAPAANDQKPFTPDDDALIADFLRRRESEIQQATEIESPRAATESTISEDRKTS